MPTIHREGGFRFHFYGQDHPPPHIHAEGNGHEARFLLKPVRLLSHDGFNARDLAKIERIVHMRQTYLEDRWHGHFGKRQG